MSLVPVAWPASESETVVMTSLLDSQGIPVFVHGGGLASILPGVQISAYNTRMVMVPASRCSDALAALSVLRHDPSQSTHPPATWRDKLRMTAEALLFGWFVPGTRVEAADDSRLGT